MSKDRTHKLGGNPSKYNTFFNTLSRIVGVAEAKILNKIPEIYGEMSRDIQKKAKQIYAQGDNVIHPDHYKVKVFPMTVKTQEKLGKKAYAINYKVEWLEPVIKEYLKIYNLNSKTIKSMGASL